MTPIGLSCARAVLAGGVLLLPWLAAADSQPQGGVGAKNLRASAHLDFRIVIPRMLALQVDARAAPAIAGPTAGPASVNPASARSAAANPAATPVANPAAANPAAANPAAANPAAAYPAADATAATSATVDADDPAQSVTVYGNGRTIALGATAADDSPSGLILSAAARKAIAQDAVCAPAPVVGAVRGIVCTASSP
jgi:hypothetical protein